MTILHMWIRSSFKQLIRKQLKPLSYDLCECRFSSPQDVTRSRASRQTARFKTDLDYEGPKISVEEAFSRIFPPDRAAVLAEKLAEISEEKRRKSWGWWAWKLIQ